MAFVRSLAVTVLLAGLARGEDPVAALAQRIEQGAAQLPFDRTYGYLPALLEALRVPVESQMAVFSKTSIQSMIIQPSNPRVLYFNDSVSVGWVHGGFLEMAAQDRDGAINYYVLMQRLEERITRRQDCAKCHKSSALLLRSVTPSPFGIPYRDTDVDGRTPYDKLWGGWFVTGAQVPAGHRGNAVFEKPQQDSPERRSLEPAFDSQFSLAPSSDAVALMVFVHQMHMMNLLANPANVNELVDYLLLVNAAPLPGTVRGTSAFAANFSAQGPRDADGRSLRDFDLTSRLMRWPCSYMIYSDAFDGLPEAVKDAVYKRMWEILSGEITGPLYDRLQREDRLAVVEILRNTKPGLPEYFKAGQAVR